MISYPIRLVRKGYRGSNTKKKIATNNANRMIESIEQHINKEVIQQTDSVHTYSYSNIAEATGYPLNFIRDLCIDGGHHGFTVARTVPQKN